MALYLKTPDEIAIMREAGRIVARAHAAIDANPVFGRPLLGLYRREVLGLERATDLPEAAPLIRREYRKGWDLIGYNAHS